MAEENKRKGGLKSALKQPGEEPKMKKTVSLSQDIVDGDQPGQAAASQPQSSAQANQAKTGQTKK